MGEKRGGKLYPRISGLAGLMKSVIRYARFEYLDPRSDPIDTRSDPIDPRSEIPPPRDRSKKTRGATRVRLMPRFRYER